MHIFIRRLVARKYDDQALPVSTGAADVYVSFADSESIDPFKPLQLLCPYLFHLERPIFTHVREYVRRENATKGARNNMRVFSDSPAITSVRTGPTSGLEVEERHTRLR